jgi:hypothetical protein
VSSWAHDRTPSPEHPYSSEQIKQAMCLQAAELRRQYAPQITVKEGPAPVAPSWIGRCLHHVLRPRSSAVEVAASPPAYTSGLSCRSSCIRLQILVPSAQL